VGAHKLGRSHTDSRVGRRGHGGKRRALHSPTNSLDAYVCDDTKMASLQGSILDGLKKAAKVLFSALVGQSKRSRTTRGGYGSSMGVCSSRTSGPSCSSSEARSPSTGDGGPRVTISNQFGRDTAGCSVSTAPLSPTSWGLLWARGGWVFAESGGPPMGPLDGWTPRPGPTSDENRPPRRALHDLPAQGPRRPAFTARRPVGARGEGLKEVTPVRAADVGAVRQPDTLDVCACRGRDEGQRELDDRRNRPLAPGLSADVPVLY
jgi:hypothetical protein